MYAHYALNLAIRLNRPQSLLFSAQGIRIHGFEARWKGWPNRPRSSRRWQKGWARCTWKSDIRSFMSGNSTNGWHGSWARWNAAMRSSVLSSGILPGASIEVVALRGTRGVLRYGTTVPSRSGSTTYAMRQPGVFTLCRSRDSRRWRAGPHVLPARRHSLAVLLGFLCVSASLRESILVSGEDRNPECFVALADASGERGNSGGSLAVPPVSHNASNAIFHPIVSFC